MTYRDSMLKWVAYLAALIVIALLNYSVIGFLPISLPLLLPMAAAAAGLLERSSFGALFGLLAGLLLSALGHTGPFAMVMLSALGWLCGQLSRRILHPNLLWFLALSALVMLLRELWQVSSLLLRGQVGFAPLLNIALREFLWSLAWAIPLYLLLGLCHRRWSHE